MRPSVLSIVLAVALFSECCTMTSANPMGKTDDSAPEQETLLIDDPSETALAPDMAALGRGGSPKIIVVGDVSLWRSMRGLDRLPLYKQSGLTLERREAGQKETLEPSISIFRRDTMRCMVGRVYRPCWEA